MSRKFIKYPVTAAATIYFDPEHDKVVDESYIRRQYDRMVKYGYTHKSYDQYVQDNFIVKDIEADAFNQIKSIVDYDGHVYDMDYDDASNYLYDAVFPELQYIGYDDVTLEKYLPEIIDKYIEQNLHM